MYNSALVQQKELPVHMSWMGPRGWFNLIMGKEAIKIKKKKDREKELMI